MQKRVSIPSKPRFSLAAQRAYDLLAELEICQFPVDPRKIIRHFPTWHLKGWIELQVNTGENDPLNLNRENAEAKTVKLRGSDDYLIVYDERVDNIQRIRWTLAHEIGHIIMGHLIEFDATALNRRGLDEKEYGILEVEAHWFAAELLAPKTIITRFSFHNNPQGISLICDISKDAAKRRLKEIRKIDYCYYSSENRILRNFYGHLARGDFYQVVHDTACRFYPSIIYPNLCKECRICRSCSSFVTDETYKYCPSCGTDVPDPNKYTPYKQRKGLYIINSISDIHSEVYLQGKQYYEFPMKNNSLIFCPVCKNYEAIDLHDTCTACGMPTKNYCTLERRTLPTGCRFCPYCGTSTTFKDVYDKIPQRLSVNTIVIPDVYDDYIECEFWPFIVMTIGMWENLLDLYVALEDSIAIYDEDEMVIFVRGINEQIIVNQGINAVLECISKNGYLSVKHLRVIMVEPITA